MYSGLTRGRDPGLIADFTETQPADVCVNYKGNDTPVHGKLR